MYQTATPLINNATDEPLASRGPRPGNNRLAETRGRVDGSLEFLVRLASTASAHRIPSARRILVWARTTGQRELAVADGSALDDGRRLLELEDEIDALSGRLLRQVGVMLARAS